MSSTTVTSLKHIRPTELASMLRRPSAASTVAVVDVRGSDFFGGHIRGCENVPTSTHDHAMPELVRRLQGRDTVVFHCALSQQRGPSSALRYLRERERLGLGGGEQDVVVLEGGFARWQELYGEDKALTEGYQKDIWEYGGS